MMVTSVWRPGEGGRPAGADLDLGTSGHADVNHPSLPNHADIPS